MEPTSKTKQTHKVQLWGGYKAKESRNRQVRVRLLEGAREPISTPGKMIVINLQGNPEIKKREGVWRGGRKWPASYSLYVAASDLLNDKTKKTDTGAPVWYGGGGSALFWD